MVNMILGNRPSEPRDFMGNTELMAAARIGDLKTVKRLQAGGANLAARNGQLRSAVGLAIGRDHLGVARWLIEAGAPLTSPPRVKDEDLVPGAVLETQIL